MNFSFKNIENIIGAEGIDLLFVFYLFKNIFHNFFIVNA